MQENEFILPYKGKEADTDLSVLVIKQVFDALQQEKLRNLSLYVNVSSKLERLQVKDIYAIEGKDNYVTIYTKEKNYTLRSTMTEIEDRLPQADFVRVHRSYIVRLHSISVIEGDTLTIEHKTIPISNSYKQLLHDRLNIVGDDH